jgi:hypothetical protein
MAVLAVGAEPLATPYSLAIGGTNIDQAWSVAADADGNAWVAGLTYSADFPSTPPGVTCAGVFQGGGTDVFVARFEPNGTLRWCRMLGGTSLDGGSLNQTPAIANGPDGSVWVTGATHSPDFPSVGGGVPCHPLGDIFVAKLDDATGVLLYSGCFDGPGHVTDSGTGIAVDGLGHAWITGFVGTWHMTDAFLLELYPDGTLGQWITFGGMNDDRGVDIAVGPSGSIHVGGVTHSSDFQTTDGSVCTTNEFGFCWDGFVLAWQPEPPAAPQLLFSTLIGTSANDEIASLAVDAEGNSYVGGVTWIYDQAEDGFVSSLTSSGLPRYFTPLSGESRDWVIGVAPDTHGNAWVTGYSRSFSLFRDVPPLDSLFWFLTRLDPSGQGFWCTQRMTPGVEDLAAGHSGTTYLSGTTNEYPYDGWVARIVYDVTPTVRVTLTPTEVDTVNHKLVDIVADVTVSDYCDPSPKVVLLSVVSNEPDNGLGDGDTPNDIQGAAFGTDDRHFQVRAERAGSGSGRTYTVTYRAIDDAGNYADAIASVHVRIK